MRERIITEWMQNLELFFSALRPPPAPRRSSSPTTDRARDPNINYRMAREKNGGKNGSTGPGPRSGAAAGGNGRKKKKTYDLEKRGIDPRTSRILDRPGAWLQMLRALSC